MKNTIKREQRPNLFEALPSVSILRAAKKLYALMLLFTVSSVCFSPATEAAGFSPAARERVQLQGRWPETSIKSASDLVQAFLDEQTLEIYFRVNVGTVVVSVERNNETLYHQDVDTADNMQVFIDLSAFESGSYILKIVNDKGECLTGEFIR